MDLHPEHSSASDLQPVTEDEGCSVPPPNLPEEHLQPHPPAFPQWDLVSVSKEDAQRALIQHAAERRCRSQRPAEQCVITNMESFNTYRYRLETFTETRTRRAGVRSYYGQLLDNDGTPPPEIWEMEVQAPPFFQDGDQTIYIPNTEAKRDCSNCSAKGESRCLFCDGYGRSNCWTCGGSGSFYQSGNRRTCSGCGGSGRSRCFKCSGLGRITCTTCRGDKKVVVFLNLVVIWKSHVLEQVLEQSSGLKMSQLDDVSGKELFSQTDSRVHPISNFPKPGVVQASERLLKEHRDKFLKTARVLQQRQTIEELPVAKVMYEWRGKSHVFFVYGTENKVSTEDYPAACCCCCCSVM